MIEQFRAAKERAGLPTLFGSIKPKQPTIEDLQKKKEEEMRKKQEKEDEAVRRREEMMKKKTEEQREKREERIRRVQEARIQQEQEKSRKNQAREQEEKLAALKRREERLKLEAQKQQQEAQKQRQAEERRKREAEEEEIERRKKKEQEQQDEEERRRKRVEEEEARRRKREEAEAALQNKKRDEEERQQREKELAKATAPQPVTKAANLNSTFNKSTALNTTQTLAGSSQEPQSYDMTPARIELPPEPSKTKDDYGLDDLKSDEETDDEDNPRKVVPAWAQGSAFRTALLKQMYMGPDPDLIFDGGALMPDLSAIFKQQRKRFFKRTSSACWETPPNSKLLKM